MKANEAREIAASQCSLQPVLKRVKEAAGRGMFHVDIEIPRKDSAVVLKLLGSLGYDVNPRMGGGSQTAVYQIAW